MIDKQSTEDSDPRDHRPYFRCHVFVCENKRAADHPRGCCAHKGSVELRSYMKARVKELGIEGVRINSAGCLDRCERGPTVVIYPEGVWYTCKTREDAEEIMRGHIRDGGRVPHLMMPLDDE